MSSKQPAAVPVRHASRRAAEMPRSAIREIMALAAGRPNVIHLEVGEPDFSTPQHIIDAAFRAASAGWTKYSPNAGLPALRQQVAARASRHGGEEPVVAEQVVITTGAIGALYSALMAVIDAGDEVLIPDPGWPNYEAIVHLAGAKAVRYQERASRGFLPDTAEIADLITPRTKALLINTPGNPSGAVFPAGLMAEIAAIVRRTGIYLVSDEIYEDIVFESEHVSAAADTPADRVFIVSGFSKSYAMTGWRLAGSSVRRASRGTLPACRSRSPVALQRSRKRPAKRRWAATKSRSPSFSEIFRRRATLSWMSSAIPRCFR